MPARFVIGGGLLLVGIGGFCMAVLDAGSGWPALIPGLALVGVGTGLVSPGLAGAALAAVPPARAGMAGGAVNTFRQLGYALGVAVLGTVLASRMQDTLGPAAHAVAGGGAGSLHDMASDHMASSHTAPDHMVSQHMVSEHMVRIAFASGLNMVAVVAGAAGLVAGVLVLTLVRGRRERPSQDSGDLGREHMSVAETV